MKKAKCSVLVAHITCYCNDYTESASKVLENVLQFICEIRFYFVLWINCVIMLVALWIFAKLKYGNSTLLMQISNKLHKCTPLKHNKQIGKIHARNSSKLRITHSEKINQWSQWINRWALHFYMNNSLAFWDGSPFKNENMLYASPHFISI